MNLDDLRRFLVVAQTSHITEAAELLGLPQSTLSRSIMRLEYEYGCRLFDRIGRRIQLNPQGETLHEYGARIVAELDAAAESMAGERDPSRGIVQLGFLNSLATWLIPPLLRDFRQGRPFVDFALRQDSPETLAQAIRDRRLHLAIVSPRPADRVFEWRPLHTEQLCVTLPVGHPLAKRRRLRLEQITDERIVLLRSATSIRETIENLANREGLSLKINLRDDEINTVRALVVAGIGITVSPRPVGMHQVFAEQGLADVPLSDRGATREIGVIWQRQVRLPAVAERFIEYALSVSKADGVQAEVDDTGIEPVTP